MGLGVRKVLVLILSVAGGFGGLYAMFALVNALYGAGMDWDRYGTAYSVLTIVPIAILVGIWLDYFFRAGFIPEPDESAMVEEGE